MEKILWFRLENELGDHLVSLIVDPQLVSFVAGKAAKAGGDVRDGFKLLIEVFEQAKRRLESANVESPSIQNQGNEGTTELPVIPTKMYLVNLSDASINEVEHSRLVNVIRGLHISAKILLMMLAKCFDSTPFQRTRGKLAHMIHALNEECEKGLSRPAFRAEEVMTFVNQLEEYGIAQLERDKSSPEMDVFTFSHSGVVLELAVKEGWENDSLLKA